MDLISRDFREAHLNFSGLLLATTITPIAPLDDPSRLRRFHDSSSQFTISTDVRSGFLSHAHTELRLSKVEGNAWVDVYVAYWRAVGAILDVENSEKGGHSKVYESWKEVMNGLIRGYSNCGFESWTIPCLYVTGRYLRAFAIKADDEQRSRNGIPFGVGIQDDIAGDHAKNERLEDAARIINRIFTLCISDRYVVFRFVQEFICVDPLLRSRARAPLETSRKWGLYYTTNLLFKTYFKVTLVSPVNHHSS